MNEETKKFKVGKNYFTRSACNHDCIFDFTIIRRTAKSVWVNVDGKVVRRSISVWNGVESFMPFGSYSMAPCIRAN